MLDSIQHHLMQVHFLPCKTKGVPQSSILHKISKLAEPIPSLLSKRVQAVPSLWDLLKTIDGVEVVSEHPSEVAADP